MKKVIVTGGSGFIGRHLVPHLLAGGYSVINLDQVPPAEPEQRLHWRAGSILDPAALGQLFREVRPDAVIHLAARAVMEGRSIADFRENTEGTANVLSAVKAVGGVDRLIVTSSQHVRRPGSGPAARDDDYAPHGLYGESKVITEDMTRRAGLPGHWMIVRPTAVWGAHHPYQVDGMWRLMHRGRYFHPARDPVVRNYGYITNVVWQLERILAVPAGATHGRTLYVGDENSRQYDWVNAFARGLTGRDVRTIPLGLIRGLSLVGDGMHLCGLPFPIYASRLYNLITSNPVPIEPTFAILGRGPVSLEQGVAETVAWLKERYRQQ